MTAPPRISVSCEVGEEHAGFLERQLRAAWSRIEAPPAAISLAVVGAQTISRLHEQFLGKSGPTDVLSFELAHDASGRVSEGEIVICLEEAKEQAARRGHAVENELLLYALHGLLHLSGYGDLDEAGYKRMHSKEDEILSAIGIGAVFARGDS